MPERYVTYKEPADYFNEGMRQTAKEWDKAHSTETDPHSGDNTLEEKGPDAGKCAGKKK